MLAWGQRTPLLRGEKESTSDLAEGWRNSHWLLGASDRFRPSVQKPPGRPAVSPVLQDRRPCRVLSRGVCEEGTFSRVGGGAGELRASALQASLRDETEEVPAPVQLMFC